MSRALHPDRCDDVSTIVGFDSRFSREVPVAPPAPGDVVVQGLDLTGSTHSATLLRRSWEGVVFLGCRMDPAAELHVIAHGGTVFPPFEGLPYQPYRSTLYTTVELATGDTDEKIYRHQQRFRGSEQPPVLEALAQRIHDHAIDIALAEFLDAHERVVAIMGGHAIGRDDPVFRTVATLARSLTRAGHLVVTGGGPGAMEAANLGAWLSPYSDDALDVAISSLRTATDYTTAAYLRAATDVLSRCPDGAESLAIPTWFYGHEPTNAFATAIAKYFSNSIREDGLLAIATHGVVYTPGAAGTVQEVFMDATQNHYATFDVISPMIFLDSSYWADDRLGAPRLLRQLAGDREYRSMIAVLDDPDEIVTFIENHPPRVP